MIVNRQRGVRVPAARLEEFLRKVERLLRLPPRAVTVCLLSDAGIAAMNRRFRGCCGPTDVLSFPADGDRRWTKGKPGRKLAAFPPGDSALYLGDIAIAPGVARRNARRAGRAAAEELRILILHGVLHLMGYDHEIDRGKMDRRERALRARLGLS
jgi:probable rRNA maturation factor